MDGTLEKPGEVLRVLLSLWEECVGKKRREPGGGLRGAGQNSILGQ